MRIYSRYDDIPKLPIREINGNRSEIAIDRRIIDNVKLSHVIILVHPCTFTNHAD